MFSRSPMAVAIATVALLSSAAFGSPIPQKVARQDSTILTYHMYNGDGSTDTYWPHQGEWLGSFDEMFELNTGMLSISCAQFGTENNSPDEIESIRDAITSVSEETGVDPRFILAVMIQESKGCVRAPTTNNGVRNPGLFQCHNGSASCNDGGNVQVPCPAETIRQMVEEGVAGTGHGDGLLQLIEKAGGLDNVSSYYRASRMYNSGSIATSGNLGDGIATKCYASDVANRLLGWVDGPSECCLDHGCSVSDPTPNIVSISRFEASGGSSQVTPISANNAPQKDKPTKRPVTKPTEFIETASTGCSQEAAPKQGETCTTFAAQYGLSASEFMKLNPSINNTCTNMLAGHKYCVA